MLFENKIVCLTLNAHWQPIGYKSIKEAMSDFCGGGSGHKPTLHAINFDYKLDENNYPVYDEIENMVPCSWDEWLTLPIRKWDLTINTPNKVIRVPTVLIFSNYKGMPVKNYDRVPSKYDIYTRDKGICQYTNKKINKKDGTIDHVIPKSKGGKNSWENMVFCSKQVNLKKSNKSLKDLNLKLINEPIKPKSIPICNLINISHHPSWNLFIKK
jgi:5-methylcytosine-specific restriction endonuclease McrA